MNREQILNDIRQDLKELKSDMREDLKEMRDDIRYVKKEISSMKVSVAKVSSFITVCLFLIGESIKGFIGFKK